MSRARPPKPVLQITHIISGLGRGGAEAMLAKLLGAPAEESVSSTVISLTNVGVVGEELRSRGVEVIALGITPGNAVTRFIRLVQLLRQLQPQVVQTWMYHANLFGGLAAKLSGVRHVVWNIRHGDPRHAQLKRSTRWIIRAGGWLSRWIPSHIICCADSIRKSHAQFGYAEQRMRTIYNGFETQRFVPNPQAHGELCAELELSEDAQLVGLVARYHPLKGHEFFIEAAAKLAADHPQAVFVLCGLGADENNQQLVASLKTLGLRARFHLLGERQDSTLVQAALTVACSASLQEGFSNAIGEAMACSVSCVVTDVGDSATLVADTGWIVAAGNALALADSIALALAESPSARAKRGQRARERIVTRFSLARSAKAYQDLYLSLQA